MFRHLLVNKFRQKLRFDIRSPRFIQSFLIISGIALLFMVIAVALAYKLFHDIVIIDPVVGPVLSFRMISVLLLLIIPISTLSISLMSLSIFFQSQDLPLWFLSPVNTVWIYFDKKADVFLRGFFISGSFLFAIFFALAFSLGRDILFLVVAFVGILPFLFILLSLGNQIALLSAHLFSFRRSQTFYTLLATVFFGSLGLILRYFRPEKLVKPDARLKFSEFIAEIKIPLGEWLPSDWFAQSLQHFYFGEWSQMLFFLAALYLLALTLASIEVTLVQKYYRVAWQRYHQEREGHLEESGFIDFEFINNLFRDSQTISSTILRKDLLLLKRDTGQWSQIIIFFFMIIIYLYSVTCIADSSAGNTSNSELFFFNLGFALFIVSALSARFIYTSIGAEEKRFQIYQVSGIPISQLLWAKILFYLPGVLFFSCILTVGLNSLIVVPPTQQILSLVDMALLGSGVVFLSASFGAIFADFDKKSLEEKAFGLGNLLFIIVSLFYIGSTLILQLASVSVLIGNIWPQYQGYFFYASFTPSLFVLGLSLPLANWSLGKKEW